jgi:hypothetical protein
VRLLAGVPRVGEGRRGTPGRVRADRERRPPIVRPSRHGLRRAHRRGVDRRGQRLTRGEVRAGGGGALEVQAVTGVDGCERWRPRPVRAGAGACTERQLTARAILRELEGAPGAHDVAGAGGLRGPRPAGSARSGLQRVGLSDDGPEGAHPTEARLEVERGHGRCRLRVATTGPLQRPLVHVPVEAVGRWAAAVVVNVPAVEPSSIWMRRPSTGCPAVAWRHMGRWSGRGRGDEGCRDARPMRSSRRCKRGALHHAERLIEPDVGRAGGNVDVGRRGVGAPDHEPVEKRLDPAAARGRRPGDEHGLGARLPNG